MERGETDLEANIIIILDQSQQIILHWDVEIMKWADQSRTLVFRKMIEIKAIIKTAVGLRIPL